MKLWRILTILCVPGAAPQTLNTPRSAPGTAGREDPGAILGVPFRVAPGNILSTEVTERVKFQILPKHLQLEEALL